MPESGKKGVFSEELTQELSLCRERMEAMRVRISNMNNDMSNFRHEYLEGFRGISEHLEKQDEVLKDFSATSKWVRDEFAPEMKKSVKELTDPVKELVGVFEATKGGFKVLGWLAIGLKWVGFLAAAVASIYGLVLIIEGKAPPSILK